MQKNLHVQIGRDNEHVLRFTIDGQTVPESTVTRVVFRFGSWCLDTDEDDNIELTDSATKVRMQLGLTASLNPGAHKAMITVYDAETPNGIAWRDPGEGAIYVVVEPWPVCD